MGWYDPYGLFGVADLPTVPQSVIDAFAGLGDEITSGFGLFDTSLTDVVRKAIGVNGSVDKCSRAYSGGQRAGDIWGLAFTASDLYKAYQLGWELSIGKNIRLAPFGNRSGHLTGRFPHYHRRSIDSDTGETKPGQGIGRHRPWDQKSTDKSFWDRF